MHRLEPLSGLRYEARGSVMWFKATGADTGGRFSLMERTLPAGGRMPPVHRHVANYEAYFVLEGSVEFRVGQELSTGTSGVFLHVPAGEPHTFGNTSPAPARLLVLHAPALDGYFRELGQLWAGEVPPQPEDERELMARYGMEPF